MSTPTQRPEGALIERLRTQVQPAISGRAAAKAARISASRWTQIVRGYKQETPDLRVPVRAPAHTLARMAQVVGATPDQLREAGRKDAADALRALPPLDESRTPTRSTEVSKAVRDQLRISRDIAALKRRRREGSDWSEDDEGLLSQLEQMKNSNRFEVERSFRSALQESLEPGTSDELVDLWRLARPFDHPAQLEADQVMDGAINLARAVSTFTERRLGGYSRAQALSRQRDEDLEHQGDERLEAQPTNPSADHLTSNEASAADSPVGSALRGVVSPVETVVRPDVARVSEAADSSASRVAAKIDAEVIDILRNLQSIDGSIDFIEHYRQQREALASLLDSPAGQQAHLLLVETTLHDAGAKFEASEVVANYGQFKDVDEEVTAATTEPLEGNVKPLYPQKRPVPPGVEDPGVAAAKRRKKSDSPEESQ